MQMYTKFIAEVSSNHHRSLERCFRFIETAVKIKCNAVKFQLFKIEQLFTPEILEKSKEHQSRKAWELPIKFLPSIAEHCHKLNIQFGCSPFYIKAVEQLLPFVDFYKIASYELLWGDLLKVCAQTKKSIILSTGMATLEEVQTAVGILRDSGCQDLTLLHCVSGYPTPFNEANLAAIETIRAATGCSVGWSDHTVNPAVIYRAAHHWNASSIEFHLDLEGKGEEFKSGHCWLPEQIQPVIATVRAGFTSDGSGDKQPSVSELSDREWRREPSDGLRPLLSMREKLNKQKKCEQ